MGKSGKHKKHLKAERAKTKLKQKTKFLPKGLNVTKVDFKVKPIVLPQQLKQKSEDELLSKRKLSVQELLSRLKHHNVTVKSESLSELCAIVCQHSESVLQENLSVLLKAGCGLLLESEKTVRNGAVKLIETILNNVDANKIEPFFNVLLLHLQCCMTNINVGLQETSLMLLDVLSKHVPRLVAVNSKQLLQNYFSLISVSRNNSLSLTVNVGSKMTNVKWRIKVLSRLCAILQAVANLEERATTETDNGCMVVDVTQTSTVAIYKNFYEQPPLQMSTYEEDRYGLVACISTVIPLLYETWLEVAPKQKPIEIIEDATTLTDETATVLGCVVKVYDLLLRHVKKKNIIELFNTADSTRFLNNLLGRFPYCQNAPKLINRSRSKTAKDTNADSKCVQENLLICHAFCAINTDLKHRDLIKQANEVVTYINRCLLNRNYVDRSNLRHLLAVIETILVDNAENWMRKRVPIERFLENVLHYYELSFANRTVDRGLLHVLCSVYKKSFVNDVVKYQTWLNALPKLLCQNVLDESVVNVIIDISRRNNRLFQRGLLQNLPQILDNLPNMTKSNQMKIATLFYHTRDLNQFNTFIKKHAGTELAILIADVIRSWYELNTRPDHKRLFERYPWLN